MNLQPESKGAQSNDRGLVLLSIMADLLIFPLTVYLFVFLWVYAAGGIFDIRPLGTDSTLILIAAFAGYYYISCLAGCLLLLLAGRKTGLVIAGKIALMLIYGFMVSLCGLWGTFQAPFESITQFLINQFISIGLAVFVIVLFSLKTFHIKETGLAIRSSLLQLISPLWAGLLLLWCAFCLLMRQAGLFFRIVLSYHDDTLENWAGNTVIIWGMLLSGVFLVFIGILLKKKRYEEKWQYPLPAHKKIEIKGNSVLARVARFFRKLT